MTSSEDRPNKSLILGGSSKRQREETFADGQLTVVSARGLRFSEKAIVDMLPKGRTGRALVIGSQNAFLAYALRLTNPDLEVCCHYYDEWYAARARETLEQTPDHGITISVATDPPPGPYQFVVVPFEKQGIADLVRDTVRRAASEWLAPNGLLFTSSDNEKDEFIRDEIRRTFGVLPTAKPAPKRRGIGYVIRQQGQAKVNPPDRYASFTYKEGDQLLTFETRLGNFCHGRLDDGTRALLAVSKDTTGERILDLGCGCGVAGIVMALRNPGSHVTFADSSTFAIEATQRNVARHELSGRSSLILTADTIADAAKDAPFDCVVTNPPYYGNLRIAEMFLETAARHLRPGGKLIVVTKSPSWYSTRLETEFKEITIVPKGGYAVLLANR